MPNSTNESGDVTARPPINEQGAGTAVLTAFLLLILICLSVAAWLHVEGYTFAAAVGAASSAVALAGGVAYGLIRPFIPSVAVRRRRRVHVWIALDDEPGGRPSTRLPPVDAVEAARSVGRLTPPKSEVSERSEEYAPGDDD